jgi:hypothetical protein
VLVFAWLIGSLMGCVCVCQEPLLYSRAWTREGGKSRLQLQDRNVSWPEKSCQYRRIVVSAEASMQDNPFFPVCCTAATRRVWNFLIDLAHTPQQNHTYAHTMHRALRFLGLEVHGRLLQLYRHVLKPLLDTAQRFRLLAQVLRSGMQEGGAVAGSTTWLLMMYYAQSTP